MLEVIGENGMWIIFVVVVLGSFYLFSMKGKSTQQSTEKPKDSAAQPEEKKKYFSLQELNGYNDKQLYISLRQVVYDVSKKSDFYGPDGGYHLFAGREASLALAKMSFELDLLDITLKDNEVFLADLTFMEKEVLNDWVMKFSVFNAYPIKGRVLLPQDMSVSTLEQHFDGSNDENSVYVILNGKVHDVTLFGIEDLKVNVYGGKDITCALLNEDFSEENLNNTIRFDQLSAEEQKKLTEKILIFTKQHPIVGNII